MAEDAHLEIVAVVGVAGLKATGEDLSAVAEVLRCRQTALPHDCTCTPGTLCRQNAACPRLARVAVER